MEGVLFGEIAGEAVHSLPQVFFPFYDTVMVTDQVLYQYLTTQMCIRDRRLVHTLKNSKQHNLSKLLGATHKYSPELQKIFPRKPKEEKRLFELLRLAYVEARDNSKLVVTKEEIEALFPKVERLRDITEEICKSQIETYRQMGQ